MGAHVFWVHGVAGSSPVSSTISQSRQVVKTSGSYPDYREFESLLCNQMGKKRMELAK